MNFQTLSRKELQAICKKNKIPANITNVAMADALSALPQVEGLDEILNPREGDAGTPAILQRTSTQRKAVKESERTKVSTRPSRGTRAVFAEGVVEQENKDANVSATPAVVPSSRRPAVSTRRKKEVIVIEDDVEEKNDVQGKVPKTPAAAPSSRKRATGRSVCNKKETPSGTSVQKGYSTRRSVRLLGKSLSEMSLMETEDMGLSKIDDVSEEMSGVSQHTEESSNTEQGASLQTVSTVLTENTEDSEVSSNKADCECQSSDMGSEVKSVSETENVAEDELHVEPQEDGYEKVNQGEADNEYQSRDLGSDEKLVSESENDAEAEVQAEPHEESSEKVNRGETEPIDSSSILEGSFDACDDSNEAGSELLPELDSCNSAKQDAFSVEVPEEASMVIADDANEGSEQTNELENKEYGGIKQDTLSFETPEEAAMEFADQAIVSSDAFADSNEAGSEQPNELENKEYGGIKQDTLSVETPEEAAMEFADEAIVSSDAFADSNEAGSEQLELEESCDSAALEIKECLTLRQDALSAETSEEVFMEFVHQASVEVSVKASKDIVDQDTVPVVPPPVHDASVNLEEIVDNQIEGDAANQDMNNLMHDNVDDHSADNQVIIESDDDNQEKDMDAKPLNVADGNHIQILDPMHDDEEQTADDKKELSNSEAVLEIGLFSSGQKQEQALELKQELSEESSEEIEKTEDTSTNSGVVNEACIEDVANKLSLLGVVAENEAEDQKDASEKLESELRTAGADTKVDAANPNMMKENLTKDYINMSVRALKKKLKEIDGKVSGKTNSEAGAMQEVDKKRTALQALTQNNNQLTTGETKHEA